MTSTLMLNERHILTDDVFVEMVVWLLDHPLPQSGHNYKYRLAFVVNGKCVVRYDNEAEKGDHKHIGNKEMPYHFFSPQTLLDDFWVDVNQWRI